MILFFAWTDIQIINCLNTKNSFFENECAELVIYKQERISKCLIQIVREKQIFSEIYEVESPQFLKRDRDNMIKSIIIHIEFKKYFLDNVKCFVKNKKYDVLLVATFWSETLNLYRYLRKFNSDIDIEIIEEGMANYNGPKDWIYRAAPSSFTKALLRDIFYCGGSGKSARERVHCFYLYRPELSWMHKNIKTKRLPLICKKSNDVCYEVMDEWQKSIDSSLYKNNKFIFITDAPDLKNRSYEKMLSCILKSIPDKVKRSSVVKLHPLCVQQGKSKMMLYENRIKIDNRGLEIENILFHYNIDDKVLIVNQSSALLYLKCMLDKEPYVIFTYRIRPYCEERLIDKFDFFSERLRGIFSNPDKIIIPNTLKEFQAAIKIIAKKII